MGYDDYGKDEEEYVNQSKGETVLWVLSSFVMLYLMGLMVIVLSVAGAVKRALDAMRRLVSGYE